MRLVAKLTLMFLLVVCFLTTGYGYLVVSRQRQIFEQRQREAAQQTADQYRDMLVLAWRQQGRDGALQVIRAIGTSAGASEIRWVWFDGPIGAVDQPVLSTEWLQGMQEGSVFSYRDYDASGTGCLRTYYPVDLGIGRAGGLEFTDSMRELEEQTQETIRSTFGLVLSIATLSVLVMTLAGIRIVGRPLEALIEKTRRVGDGDFSGPVHLERRDELAQLAESLNQMCAQLSAQQERIETEAAARLAAMQQLRHADRLKTVGRLAAGIAHELGTPLNVVSGRAGLIASGQLPAEQVTSSAATIKKEADRITTIIRQLLDFARRSTPQRARLDLRNIVRQTIELLHGLAEKQRVEIRVTGDDQPIVARVDANQIQQVLTNILVNAIQAMPDGGTVTVALGRRMDGQPDDAACPRRPLVCLAVSDEGVGMEPEQVEQIFEPFFTTKDVGEGTGLGLSIAYGIVQEHDGWIEVSSRPGQGSRFEVCLPGEPT
jgi:signal transduction histidine kinase